MTNKITKRRSGKETSKGLEQITPMVEFCKNKICKKNSYGKRGLCLEHYEKVLANERRSEKIHKNTRSDPNRGRESRNKYEKTEKGKKVRKEIEKRSNANPVRIANHAVTDMIRRDNPEYKKKVHNEMQATKIEVFLVYSKRHSESDVPICRCCKEKLLEFLEFDHIIPRKEMTLDPNAIKWGYNPKWKGEQLWNKVKEHNYPEGFQILCSNCNQSKKNSGSRNMCFHQLVKDPKFNIKDTDRQRLRTKVFSHYSKLHNNSDIPICRCCREPLLEFLTLDHVQGKKLMDSIIELTNLGYSSEMEISELLVWIKNHNFLSNLKTEYFQVMCYKCNQAKGRSSKNNTCPHMTITLEN